MKPTPYRVLIADDDKDTADTTADLLQLDGHLVKVVYGGREAVEAARTFNPHLAILDIEMPGMDGYAAATAMRDSFLRKGLVLIAHTGRIQPADIERARRAGFDHHLAKPVGSGHLRALVNSSLAAATLSAVR